MKVKEMLSHSAMLAYPDPSKQLCMLSDASDTGWGLVITQVGQWKHDTPIQEQQHELLICMGGSFSGSALNWSVIEKESFPIVHACEKRIVSLPEDRPDLDKNLSQMRQSVRKTHKVVEDVRKRQSQRYRSRYHYERAVNFTVGDYVLRSRVDEKQHANKLRVTWVGPYRVTVAAEYFFTVEHLATGKTMKVHPSRLKHYADSSLNISTDLIDHVASQGTLLAVDALVDHRYHDDMKAFEVKVKWQGLEEIEDSWDPMKVLSEDVPQLMNNYANDKNDERLQRAVAAVLQRKKPRTKDDRDFSNSSFGFNFLW